jgi:hypothetical protein
VILLKVHPDDAERRTTEPKESANARERVLFSSSSFLFCISLPLGSGEKKERALWEAGFFLSVCVCGDDDVDVRLVSLKVERMETRCLDYEEKQSQRLLSRTREHFSPTNREKRKTEKKKYAERRELSLSLSRRRRSAVLVSSSSSSSSSCAR